MTGDTTANEAYSGSCHCMVTRLREGPQVAECLLEHGPLDVHDYRVIRFTSIAYLTNTSESHSHQLMSTVDTFSTKCWLFDSPSPFHIDNIKVTLTDHIM